jgi:hyperosmotically inducible protein
MKIILSIAGLLIGAWLLPVTGFTADTSTSAASPSANETPGATKPNPSGTTKMLRSDHPVDDATITTNIKGKFLKDKQVRLDNIEIETINGAVRLFGAAKNKSHRARAVTLARQVAGVKSVKNEIQITPPQPVAKVDNTYKERTAGTSDKRRSDDSDKDRTAQKRGSDQPGTDSWITTKVKAKFVESKEVSATDIHVKTVNGVVELTGTAKSKDESSRAESLARGTDHVKSVTNRIKVM